MSFSCLVPYVIAGCNVLFLINIYFCQVCMRVGLVHGSDDRDYEMQIRDKSFYPLFLKYA